MSKPHTGGIGDAPIEPAYIEKMNALAHAIDELLNGRRPKPSPSSPPTPGSRKAGFILMVFPFEDHAGRCNYISNANRDDVVTMLKEQLKRFEGQPEMTGHG